MAAVEMLSPLYEATMVAAHVASVVPVNVQSCVIVAATPDSTVAKVSFNVFDAVMAVT